ncbi:hypothetical protein DITRI_Ditri02bG0120200 [Diplodiscus trichospermus]
MPPKRKNSDMGNAIASKANSILAKPEVAEWQNKLEATECQPFAKDRATGQHAETAKEMRKRRNSIVEENHVDASTDTIDGIDFMVSQQEINLENFNPIDDNAQNVPTHDHEPTTRSQVNSQSEASSKPKNSKKSKIEEEVLVLKERLHNVTQAIASSTTELVKVATLPILENEV